MPAQFRYCGSMKKRSPKLDAAIVAGVTKGASLASLCQALGIARTTLAGWLRSDRAFANRLAWARDAFCGELIDECLAIADDSSGDWIARPGCKGGQVPDLEHIRGAQHAIDARMRLVAQWDRVDFHQTGARTASAEAATGAARFRE